MSKLTLFILLALTTYVLNAFNQKKTLGKITLEPCNYVGDNPAALLEELEEDYCSSLKTSIDDATHCCYFDFANDAGCFQITDDQYENVVRFKKYLRDQAGDQDDEFGIDCSSRFISFSLLFVLALLF